MLQKLIQELRSGGPQDLKALAARLDVSPQLVAAMLEHLQRAGYLRACTGAGSACLGCGLGPDCTGQSGSRPRLWELVEDQGFTVTGR